MKTVDAHQHFWHYSAEKYGWINEKMRILKKNYLPDHLKKELQKNKVDGCVCVQARQDFQETKWLLSLAEQNDFIYGVVAWLDLCSENIEEILQTLSLNKKLKGIRHILQDEADENYMLKDDFIRGLRALEQKKLTYDLLIYPKHLPIAIKLLNKLPNLSIVLDHLGKPEIANQLIDPWKTHLQELSTHKNLSCKISGLVTEANWNKWKYDNFVPYLDVVFEAFGFDRLMFGSDWPVLLLGAKDYEQAKGILEDYTEHFSKEEKNKIFGENATQFYGL